VQPLPRRLAEIELLMEYAVPPAQLAEAAGLVKKYETDAVALNVFHHFYSYLPEGLEDAIRLLRLFASREGVFLLCATSNEGDYLYLADAERAEFLGPLAEGLEEGELLRFLGFAGSAAFREQCADPGKFPLYVPAHLQANLCPVCHVAHGEPHTLGCPVEVCPWCGGQLTSCPCRFKVLGRERLTSEAQLAALLNALNKKGRVPFDAEEHRPAYPLTPQDLGMEE